MRRRPWLLPAIGALMIAAGIAYSHIEEYVERESEDFDVVIEGMLYRSEQPEGRLRHMLKRHEIRTVVDLRLKAEDPRIFAKEQARCDYADANFVNIPIGKVIPSDEQIVRFLKIVRCAAGPVLVHCQHGKSRTGIMIAAYRIVAEGWSARSAMEEMLRYGYDQDDGHHAERLVLLGRLERDRQQWLDKTAGE